MKFKRRKLDAAAIVALGGLLACSAQAQDDMPNDWLNKMTRAVQTTNYEGTVIRIKDGAAEALKVARVVSDGVIREKIVIQEGNGLEIIRNGNEVHCVLPDKKSVLVDKWDEQLSLFSTLPSSNIRFGSEYDIRIVREERVAGRKAVLLAVQPHDGYRFGHRIWLDTKTGFPLQTKLIGDDGAAIEQVKFADIRIDEEVRVGSLESSYDVNSFRWFNETSPTVTYSVETGWDGGDFPPGFRVEAAHREELPGSGQPVTHILLSDGLASVSVFVQPDDGSGAGESTRVGGSNSYSVVSDGNRITAVGEVPAATVRRIANSIQLP